MTRKPGPVVLSIDAIKARPPANDGLEHRTDAPARQVPADAPAAQAPQAASGPATPRSAGQTAAPTIHRSAKSGPEPSPPAPTPATIAPQEDGLHSLVEKTAARIEHRALLISTLAALNGVEIPTTDLAEFMWSNSPGDVSAKALSRALKHAGVEPSLHRHQKITPTAWPAVAMMTNGQSVLVLGQDAEMLSVYDPSCPDNRTDVYVAEFKSYFSGVTLSARVSLRQLAERHVPKLAPRHWFWGEFQKYRRHIGEIMLGSLVANLLAVALFSLQVYDRVIPHQSEATLWVLAAGAIAAILLEGALKLARAKMSDAAGRQMELSIQHRLMQRLLGMRSDPCSGVVCTFSNKNLLEIAVAVRVRAVAPLAPTPRGRVRQIAQCRTRSRGASGGSPGAACFSDPPV